MVPNTASAPGDAVCSCLRAKNLVWGGGPQSYSLWGGQGLWGEPSFSLGALPIQEEVAVQAALAFVPVAVILTVHTHSLVFTRPLGHPVVNLAKERRGDRKEAWAIPLLPEPQESWTVASPTSSGSSEYFSGSFLAISSSFLETQMWLLPRQKAWQGRQVPPPTAEPTNRGRHCSQWLPWKPGTGWSEQVANHGEGGSWGVDKGPTGSTTGGGRGSGSWVRPSQPRSNSALCVRLHTSSDAGVRGGGGVHTRPVQVWGSGSPSLHHPKSSSAGPASLVQH